MDCRESGEVWYRATSAEAVANLASDWVEAAGFSRAFSPAEVFVATWEKVASNFVNFLFKWPENRFNEYSTQGDSTKKVDFELILDSNTGLPAYSDTG